MTGEDFMRMRFIEVETSTGKRYVGIGHVTMVRGPAVSCSTLMLSNGESVDILESAKSFVARVANGQVECELPKKRIDEELAPAPVDHVL